MPLRDELAGRGRVMVGAEWTEFASPASVGGANTQRLHVQLDGSVDEHYERAKAQGATIEKAPEDQFYGDRSYRRRRPRRPPVDVLGEDPQRQQRGGREGARPTDHGHPGGRERRRRRSTTPRRVADPIGAGPLSCWPNARAAAGELASELDTTSVDDEQAPPRAATGRPGRRDPPRVRRPRPDLCPAIGADARAAAWLETAERGWAAQLAAFAEHIEHAE